MLTIEVGVGSSAGLANGNHIGVIAVAQQTQTHCVVDRPALRNICIRSSRAYRVLLSPDNNSRGRIGYQFCLSSVGCNEV